MLDKVELGVERDNFLGRARVVDDCLTCFRGAAVCVEGFTWSCGCVRDGTALGSAAYEQREKRSVPFSFVSSLTK